jgi:photosystem II stability/assembly factor-like uncharacterized protein
MFASDDGGLTFAPIGSNLVRNFAGLRAGPDAQSAFAFGERGAVARTSDGGATWSALAAPTNADVRDVVFTTPTDGYLLDHDGALFATSDGGSSWRRRDTGSIGPARAVAVPRPGTLVLIGPRGIFRATGAQPPSAVGGPDAARAALSAVVEHPGGPLVAYGALSRSVFSSTDDGASWTRIPLPPHTSVRARAGLDFVDSKTGFLVDGKQRVWKTTTGGRRWSELLGVGSTDVNAIVMADRTNGFIATREYAGDPSAAVVLRTSDGGRSWRPQALAPGSVRSLVVTSGERAYALVGKRYIFSTSSGGDAAAPSRITLRASANRSGGQVVVSGSLSGAAGGEQVVISRRDLNVGFWDNRLVRVTPSGGFTSRWSLKRPSVFVAQWSGDSGRGGAGSVPLVVRLVGR